MTKQFARMSAFALLLSVAVPLHVSAQTSAQDAAKKAAQAKPAPAARPAPPPRAARPAPPPAAARPAPAIARPAPVARPAPAARAAPPRPEPPAARIAPRPQAPAAARVAPQRPDRQRAVERSRPPSPQAPAINRAQRDAPAPAAPAQAAAPPAAQNAARTAAPAATPAQTPQQARQAQRQERQLRRREDRALRSLPPQERAARREQIQQQRQQRAVERQQQLAPAARSLAAPNTTATPTARGTVGVASTRSGLRRNGQARITPQVARQGRFAAVRTADTQTLNASATTADARVAAVPQARTARYAPRRAWQRGIRAAFVPWYGPVFWPYAYSDIFDYTFFPHGYEDSYWDYAYDDFFEGVFYGEIGPPQEYVTETTGSAPSTAPAQPTYTAVRDLCAQPGSGITAWPTAEIESKVGLDAEQKRLLADVKSAGTKAAAVFKATCPSENAFPLTPPGRLASMTGRLDATLSAVRIVKPAVERFYDSLNDEQKERFNQIGPPKTPASSKTTASPETPAVAPDDAKKCGEAKPGLTNLPIEQIEDVIAPNNAQQAELDKLGEATVQAVGVLQAACPAETPLTPPGRLQAIEARLQAMIEAANTVKPALNDFYASLNAEQKARFNRLGRELAQADAGAAKQ